MKWIMAVFLFIASLFQSEVSQADKKKKQDSKNPDKQKENKIETTKIIYSKAELAEKLKALKNKPKPKELSEGAMCYEMSEPPKRIEYVCQVCQHKTVYVNDRAFQFRTLLLASDFYREALNSHGIKVDATQYCKKCSPKVKNPELCIHIHYKDSAEPAKTCSVTTEDLKILNDFFAGKDKHAGDFGKEMPLSDFLERIETLLAVKAE